MGLPILPDFVAGDGDEHRSRLDALAEARRDGVEGVVGFEGTLGDLAAAPDVVVVALVLSYRAEQAWDRFFSVVARMRPELAGHPFVRQQHAFALNRAGRGQDAEQILLALREEQGPSPETNGILGRVYKDWFMATRAAGDHDAAEHWLRQAIDTYLEGHDADPTDPYPGVNALSLMEFAYPKPARRDSLVGEVAAASRRRLLGDSPRYWDYATEWELALLEGDELTARVALQRAVERVENPWQAASTQGNTAMIQTAWAARGATTPAWVDQLAGRFDTITPPPTPPTPPPPAPDPTTEPALPAEPGEPEPPSEPEPPGTPETPEPPGEVLAPEPATAPPTATPESPATPDQPAAPAAEPAPPPTVSPQPQVAAEPAAPPGRPGRLRRLLKWTKRIVITVAVAAVVGIAVLIGLLAFGPEDFDEQVEDALPFLDRGDLGDMLPFVGEGEPDSITLPTTSAPVATSAPPPATEPVTEGPARPTLYSEPDYGGRSLELVVGYNAGPLPEVGNDETSSVRVPPGYVVTLYENAEGTGRELVLTSDAPNLGQLDFDEITSNVLVEQVE